ncbi:MAG: DUF5060 domain-containing protein [Akkermansiaceae bacterium]|nr:DUF5060 domain-containing protein [Akkermansiaceae bacterium]MDP4779745.1 DUF5060 domain-containing protein [Akkermansiaceae bacterium]MDP4846594.1 DUF5060 domain-containing protein [Akkermansiaceae bacterium]MDP4897059.1 DUF5060 domain-containing protein [Akkermansiaceae bacterium]
MTSPLTFFLATLLISTSLAAPKITGEQKVWHKITLSFDGPATSENATPNPFTDYRLDVTFTHADQSFTIPGYFAADGRAAHTSAESGNQWHVHFAPNRSGDWTWKARFRKGKDVAVAPNSTAGESAGFFDCESGSLTIAASDKSAPDTRALGTVQAVGHRYPVCAGTGDIFWKVGADSPENLLSYADFDGDFKSDGKKDDLVKTWQAHVRDWKQGDPTWQDGKGKGMIGAINYLASKGLNAMSFLTFNVEGDDQNVFPYLDYHERERFDISRLAQWEIVFEHATSKGLFLHFKTQESENETLLDQGDTGRQRKLYYRELLARFSHHPALNWNLGEENGQWKAHHNKTHFQTTAQRLAMGDYFHAHDPYDHPVVIHNGQWPADLYGKNTSIDGASLQTANPTFANVHNATLNIINASQAQGKAWIVACDEPGDAEHALVPDAADPTHDNARMNALWGNLLAGGWGLEFYFGYKHEHSDLTCQDWRSRDKFWDQCRHALDFFRTQKLPATEMKCLDDLLLDAPGFCFAKPGHTYLLLVKNSAKPARLKLGDSDASFTISWFNPRDGGALQSGSITTLQGPGTHPLGLPPTDPDKDWVALIKKN